jgi:hypothetical protein
MNATKEKTPILAPYPHELNERGDGKDGDSSRCADDCPACLWLAEQQKKARR